MTYDAKWWHGEGVVSICELCPHRCRIGPGQSGLCSVRHNDGMGLKSLSFGKVSAVALDPVEKKPLFHWHPGRQILSIGGIGCSMNCPFCQNWEIARWDPSVRTRDASPSDIAEWAKTNRTKLVAFTYNEPMVSWEFLMESLVFLKKNGIETALITNGQICIAPLSELLPYVDAANLDIKAFDDEKYRQMGGDLSTAKNTVKAMAEKGVHVEISWLAVPGISDDLESFRTMTAWVASVDPTIPLHINRYFPAHRWNAPATDEALMDDMKEIAARNLTRVYQGNVKRTAVTSCLSCGAPLVERSGYNVDLSGLTAEGKCAKCGAFSDITM